MSGLVTENGVPVTDARVTLFSEDLSFFDEQRSDTSGSFAFAAAPNGTLQLGLAAVGREYQQVSVTVSNDGQTRNFALGPETQPGDWTIVGDTLPEEFGGTNSGIVTSEGRYVMCHDTINVGPGQRYDVIWKAMKPGNWLIHCHIGHHTTNNNVEMQGGGGLMMLIDVSG